MDDPTAPRPDDPTAPHRDDPAAPRPDDLTALYRDDPTAVRSDDSTPPRRHVLFVSVANHGSVIPTVAIVAELVRRGHRVTYVTSDEHAAPIAAAGAEVVRYESPFANANPAEVFADQDPMRPHRIYLDENVAILRAAQSHLGSAPPDLVVYGDFPIVAGQILTSVWRRPGCRLSPGFASNEVYSYSRDMIAESGGIAPSIQKRIDELVADLLAEYQVGRSADEVMNGIEDFTLVLIPRAFQIAEETFDERFAFVGRTPAAPQHWQPPAGGLPIVLISLGTTFNDRPELFTECARAFAGVPWHAVITTGDRVGAGDLGELPPNVEVHRWLPYPAVLAHARVFVTHGGMGAIMDSVDAGRPMVVVPQSFDVMSMARRVAELGLGTVITEFTGDRLRAAVLELAEDGQTLRRVGEMRRNARRAGGAPRAADAIEDYIDRTDGDR